MSNAAADRCAVAILCVVAWSCTARAEVLVVPADVPRSILVLPPRNESIAIEAPYVYLATISRPLAEQGYYVFPVAVVDSLMKESGLTVPAEMHAVSLERISSVVGADAVLYVTVADWGHKYYVLASETVVALRARLVAVPSGRVLWSRELLLEDGFASSGDIQVDLIVAALSQILKSTVLDPLPRMAQQANEQLLQDPEKGLEKGPRHPDFELKNVRATHPVAN